MMVKVHLYLHYQNELFKNPKNLYTNNRRKESINVSDSLQKNHFDILNKSKLVKLDNNLIYPNLV